MHIETWFKLANSSLFTRVLAVKGALPNPNDYKILELAPCSYAIYNKDKLYHPDSPFICQISIKSPAPVLDYHVFDPTMTEEFKQIVTEQMNQFVEKYGILSVPIITYYALQAS